MFSRHDGSTNSDSGSRETSRAGSTASVPSVFSADPLRRLSTSSAYRPAPLLPESSSFQSFLNTLQSSNQVYGPMPAPDLYQITGGSFGFILRLGFETCVPLQGGSGTANVYSELSTNINPASAYSFLTATPCGTYSGPYVSAGCSTGIAGTRAAGTLEGVSVSGGLQSGPGCDVSAGATASLSSRRTTHHPSHWQGSCSSQQNRQHGCSFNPFG